MGKQEQEKGLTIGGRKGGRKRTVQILRLVDYYTWMGVHKRKRWFQIQRPAHAKAWVSELHGCGAAGTLGQVQQQGQTGRGRQSTYSMLGGASGMHSVDGGGGHGCENYSQRNKTKHGDPHRGQRQQCRKGGKEELSTDSSRGDGKEGMVWKTVQIINIYKNYFSKHLYILCLSSKMHHTAVWNINCSFWDTGDTVVISGVNTVFETHLIKCVELPPEQKCWPGACPLPQSCLLGIPAYTQPVKWRNKQSGPVIKERTLITWLHWFGSLMNACAFHVYNLAIKQCK